MKPEEKIERAYEELRAIIDGGSESFTHEDAVQYLKDKLATPEQEPVAWVPYLSDRADGVKGRYAIARWNPRGYREVWNLRRHEWGAYSDDVLSLEEADTLLRLITIPTRKVTSPQPPQPKEPEQEPAACVVPHGATMRLEWASVNAAHNAKIGPLYTAPPQRTWVGLTEEEVKHMLELFVVPPHHVEMVVQAIEAKLKEKNT